MLHFIIHLETEKKKIKVAKMEPRMWLAHKIYNMKS